MNSIRDYNQYRRWAMSEYLAISAGNTGASSFCETALRTQLICDVCSRGDYSVAKIRTGYTAIWENFIPSYRLIKICTGITVKYDLFAIECNDDCSCYAVFYGSVARPFRGSLIVSAPLIIDWKIPVEEEMLIKLSI